MQLAVGEEAAKGAVTGKHLDLVGDVVSEAGRRKRLIIGKEPRPAGFLNLKGGAIVSRSVLCDC